MPPPAMPPPAMSPSVLLLKAADERYRAALEAPPARDDLRRALSVHFADVLAFRYVNAARLEEALTHLPRFSGLLLTSPRAAIAIARAVEALGAAEKQRAVLALRALPVFSVGAATSRELEPLGVKCRGADSGSAEALADYLHGADGALPVDCGSKPVLFLCGEKRREVLPDSFRARGLPMEQLVVYETCAVDELAVPTDCGTPAWVVFFSPSGLKAAKHAPLPWRAIKKAAIGKTTASALQEHAEQTGEAFWAADVVAAKPTPEALAAAIFEHDAREARMSSPVL